MNEENKLLKIEGVSEKQLNIMRDALEFYSRLLSGQFDALPDELRFPLNRAGGGTEELQSLKTKIFPELRPNESYGISAPDKGDYIAENRQISYEMYRQIYVYQTAQRKAAGDNVSMNVYDSPTMRYSDEKLIQIVKQ